jgi:hypothetical protein
MKGALSLLFMQSDLALSKPSQFPKMVESRLPDFTFLVSFWVWMELAEIFISLML